MRNITRQLGFLALALAGAVMTFVLTTIGMDLVPDTVLVAAALVGAFVLTASAYGAGGIGRVRELRHDPDVLLAACSGILAFWAAPLLALSQRATDSPSGTDAAMLTTATWGALTVFVAFASSRRAIPYVVPAASAAGLFGAAAVLANWERPSSLNLFVKAINREVVIVIVGVAFALGAVWLSRAVARLGVGRASIISIGAATGAAVLFALPTTFTSLPAIAANALTLAMLGLGYGAFCIGWLRTSRQGASVSAVSLLLVPLALTGLSFLERRIGVAGPDPIVWSGVVAGGALGVAAAATILLGDSRGAQLASDVRPRPSKAQGLLLVGGGVAAALGFGSLLLPSIRATSEGVLGEGFHATWAMLGFETAGGWMPLVASLLALAGAVDLAAGRNRRSIAAAAVTALVAISTVPTLAAVPLHTWTTWIPSDVQQTYGTEYARMTTEPLASPVAILSLVLAGAVALAVLVLVARGGKADRDNVSEEGI